MASNQREGIALAIIIHVGATCRFRLFAFDCNMEKRELLALTVFGT